MSELMCLSCYRHDCEHIARLVATVKRGRYGKPTNADPDELLNTIPAREYPELRRFDPDPDRERDGQA